MPFHWVTGHDTAAVVDAPNMHGWMAQHPIESKTKRLLEGYHSVVRVVVVVVAVIKLHAGVIKSRCVMGSSGSW